MCRAVAWTGICLGRALKPLNRSVRPDYTPGCHHAGLTLSKKDMPRVKAQGARRVRKAIEPHVFNVDP
jgi:hypothetical protein